MTSAKKIYSDLFGLDEIALSQRLQSFFWIILGLCLFDINRFSTALNNPGREAACWEHFPSCQEWFGLQVLPNSYSYTTMTATLLALLFFSSYFAVKRMWPLAHLSLLTVIIWKFVWYLVIFSYSTSNFEYFHLIPSLTFLLLHDKLSNTRFMWALLYFFCSFVKLDESWIIGSYFTSLKVGLPFVPNALVPIGTNIIIIFEMLFSIGLLSKRPRLAQTSLILWTLFHLYSAILLGFFYPVRCLAFLWALFGFRDQADLPVSQKAKRRGRWVWVIVIYLLMGNFVASYVSKSPNDTLEALNYGFSMINSNYQCINKVRYLGANGEILKEREFGSSAPMARCNPQRTIQTLHRDCEKHENLGESISIQWRLFQSRNGGPFHETVNVDNACMIQYQAFQHNDWIRSPQDGAKLIGYPALNSIYPEGKGPLPQIFYSPQIEMSSFQNWLEDHLALFKYSYLLLWSALLTFLFTLHFIKSNPFSKIK